MKLNLKKSKGFTLIELLLVVGIIALGSVVAYITYPKVSSTSRANAEATNINTITAGIKNVYAGTNNFTSLGSDGKVGVKVLARAKALPDRMTTDTTASDGIITNGFGGAVGIAAEAIGTNNNVQSYKITYPNVPNAECTKLVTGVGNNFVQVKVNNVVLRSYGDAASNVPIDPGAAAAQCGADASLDNNTLTFWGN